MTATFNRQLTTQWKDGVFQIVEDADYNGPHHTQQLGDEVSRFTADMWLNLMVTACPTGRWGRYHTEGEEA